MFELHPQLSQDCHILGDFPLSRVLLSKDANYPWLILVPKKPAIGDIYQLDQADQQQLLAESSWVSEVMMGYFQADKMNVAALGNMVPQLHLHHVARFKNDEAWPKPIWGLLPAKPYEKKALEILLANLKEALKNSKISFTPYL